MASVAAEVQAMRYRRPWYWLVLLGVAALAATFLVVWNARARMALNDSQFVSMQMLRLQRMEQRIDDYFGDTEQIVAIGAQTLGGIRGDRALARRLTLQIFRARRNPAVYGLGAAYARFAFDSHSELFSVYDHAGTKRFTNLDVALPGGAIEAVLAGSPSDPRFDYLNQDWFVSAIQKPDEVVYDGPYTTAGISWISTLKAFRNGGKVAGVMSVDTLTTTFKGMMVSELSPGDIAWIHGSHRGFILGTSRLPKDTSMRIDRGLPLRYSGVDVHLSSDASGLFALDRRIGIVAVALIVGIWIVAAIVAQLLWQRWDSQEETLRLEVEQARLENELAVGKTVAAELRKAAFTDSLTGLPNRAAFLECVAGLLNTASDASTHAVLILDIDRFNVINETLGHLAGDELLRVFAARLERDTPPGDLVARLSGDEFVLVARVGEGGAREKAVRALESIAEPVVLYGRNIHPRASIGIVAIDASYEKPDELLRDAGIAVKEAKRRGRGRSVTFGAAMRAQAAQESELEASLRHAIERRELVPYYQPIVHVTTGAIASFEALVRWHRPDHGTVSAGAFMPFAESRALVHEIDSLVLPQVARHCAALFGLFPEASVAVNLSAAELSDRDLAGRIESLLAEHNVPPSRLKLEITETTIMTPSDEATANLKQLRGIGVQLVLDDFGTGYSSLAYLQRLPVVGLKIDRSFVEHIARDARAAELVQNVVSLAKTFSLYTVAEGVETAEQLELLAQIGVDFAQGYLYSPAVDMASISTLAAKAYHAWAN